MMLARFFCVIALTMAVALAVRTSAQVQTEVPPAVPGAKPVTAEHVKVHGIANGFEVYQGTHTSKVAERFQNHVMPFFSRTLCFQPGCR